MKRITRQGQVIRFGEDEIRPMGRSARGVKGIDLDAGDTLVSASVPRRDASLLVVTVNGHAKRVPFTEIRRQGRAGKGVSILPERGTAGDLAGLLEGHPGDLVVLEIAGTEYHPLQADTFREKPRRGASVRIPAIARRTGPVTRIFPLRSAPETEAAEEEIGSIAPDAFARSEESAPDGPGQVELELELETE